jgi:hypothetical protein
VASRFERTDQEFVNVKTWVLLALWWEYPHPQAVPARVEVRDPYGPFPGDEPTLETIAEHRDFREAVRSLDLGGLITVERGEEEWRLGLTVAGVRQLGEWSPEMRLVDFRALNRRLTTIVANLVEVTERAATQQTEMAAKAAALEQGLAELQASLPAAGERLTALQSGVEDARAAQERARRRGAGHRARGRPIAGRPGPGDRRDEPAPGGAASTARGRRADDHGAGPARAARVPLPRARTRDALRDGLAAAPVTRPRPGVSLRATGRRVAPRNTRPLTGP